MNEPRGKELIERYKSNYHMSTNAPITEEMVLRHWELEKRLTAQLLNSTSLNRWETFEKCYTQLYEQLPWLNELVDNAPNHNRSDDYTYWNMLIGDTPKSVYEVGSGKGDLIKYLAQSGHRCVGTDITRERGGKYAANHSNLTWDVTDGVHLDRFTSTDTYDVVLSDQVIEHLHPDDLLDHFKGVYKILSQAGGKYFFRTPHAYEGPSDISKVFKCDKPMGMHLKEYTFVELSKNLKIAGFTNIAAVMRVPRRVRNIARVGQVSGESKLFFHYLLGMEKMISLLPTQTMRRSFVRALKYPLFSTIFMVVKKG